MANILNVGPIVPVDKGVYNSATTYSILNLVDDGTGQVYLSKKNNNLGNNLTNGEWWGRYTGPQGPQGVKGDTGTINLAGEYGTSENVGLNQKFLTEKMAGFEEVVQTQLITTPPATLNTQVGYYYCMGGSGVVVDTMTIQLPAIADYEESKAKNVSFFMVMGSAPAVTFVSAGAERIRYQKDFALEAERGYEVNALWNSHAWVIAAVEIEIPETRVVATVNVTNTSGTTSILGNTSNISAVEIDGVEQQSVETGYTFSTTGEHTVKYTLTDPTSIGNNAFSSCTSLTSVTIPDSVTSISERAFYYCSGLTSITIPNTVISIGSSAFYYCYSLRSITIPDSVTSIGDKAFQGCSGLTSVDIPNSVTTIGDYVFDDCTGLTSITIGNNVTNIGSSVFGYCTNLTSIIVDSANTVYDSRDNCNAIINTSTNELITGCKGTVIPNTVTSIGSSAFFKCTGLTSITIPDSVTNIGSSAFSNCSGLTSVTIGSGVTSIGSSVFGYCTGLIDVTIGNGVTSIGEWAFSGCSGLTSITIPDSVTSIKGDAFSDCTSLTSITIPDSVTSIGNGAFSGCRGLTSITIPNSVTSIGNNAFQGCTNLTSVTIGSGVTTIDNYTFYYCTGLTSITSLATKAPTISSNTFQNIKTGGTLTVPSGSTGYDVWMGTGNHYLGKYGWTNKIIPFFAKLSLNNGNIVELQGSGELTQAMIKPYKSSVVRAEIGELCTSIGNEAFSSCSSLTSITIGSGVTSIGDYVFNGCSSLTSIVVDSANTIYDSRDNCNAIINKSTNELIAGCKNTVIPNTVTSIGRDAFSNCSGLTSVTIGNSVTSIGSGAFFNCTGLTSITIPDSVTSIGSWAFQSCTGLTSITCNATTAPTIQNNTFYRVKTNGTLTVPSGSRGYNVWMGTGNYYLGNYGWTMMPMNIITYEASAKLEETTTSYLPGIHTNAFSGKSGQLTITSHTFENGVGTVEFNGDVTSIGYCAFQNCSGLTSITIPDSVTSIGESAFSGCSGLTSITIPDSVTSIGESAFHTCVGLTSITIPDGVTSIGASAFGDCLGLTSVTIGNGVTSIGAYAFNYCSKLTSITSLATTAPTIESSTFQDVKTGGTLTVPSGSTGYDVWMGTGGYYLGYYNWTKVEQ